MSLDLEAQPATTVANAATAAKPPRAETKWALARSPTAGPASAQRPGRGMTPIWMREEMKGTKLKKNDFLIK